jgi:hypothetical protein
VIAGDTLNGHAIMGDFKISLVVSQNSKQPQKQVKNGLLEQDMHVYPPKGKKDSLDHRN